SGGELVVRQVPERRAQLVAAVYVDDVEGRKGGRRPGSLTGYRHRGMGLAVVAAPDRQDLVGATVLRRQHEGGVVGLGARVGEEHLGVGYARQLGDLLGELDLRLDEVQGRGV